MRKKKIMIIGPRGCGKTSLANLLNDYQGPLRKNQDIIYGIRAIDVPGAYLEIPWMYSHLISIAQNDASKVLILIDQTNQKEVYPPGFAKVFGNKVTGVIIKCDLMGENEANSMKQLKRAGVPEPYFKISLTEKIGIDELETYLFNENQRERGEMI